MKLSTLNDILCEGLEEKRPHLLGKLAKYGDKAEEMLQYCLDTDPKYMETRDFDNKSKKAPFVDTIVKWLLNNKITLPEDIETTRDIINKYREYKNKAPINNIDTFDSPGAVLEITSREVLRDYGSYLPLIAENGNFKLYRVDNWEKGKKAFPEDCTWCVKHNHHFMDYGPPFFLATKGNKRYSLMQKKHFELKNALNQPFDNNGLEPILKFVKIVWPEFEIKMLAKPDFVSVPFSTLWPDFFSIVTANPDGPSLCFTLANMAGEDESTGNKPRNSDLELVIINHMKNMVNPSNPNTVDADNRKRVASESACKYAKYIIGGRWPEAEPIIIESPQAAYYYARHILNGKWPEAEPIIMTNPNMAVKYAAEIIGGRWPEAEPSIIKDAHATFIYVQDVIKERWPEGEYSILKSSHLSFLYAVYFIGGRWPQAESIINMDPTVKNRYDSFVTKGKV